MRKVKHILGKRCNYSRTWYMPVNTDLKLQDFTGIKLQVPAKN